MTDPFSMTERDRGRRLTEEEIEAWLADHQTPIRHGIAPPALEAAAELRDLLTAERSKATLEAGGSINDRRRAAGITEEPHQHRWIPVQAVGGDTYGATRYVMFGCECGEALRSVAVDHPASRFKELVHAAILDGSRIDPQLTAVDSNVKKLVDTLARLERAWSELPE